MKSVKGWVRWEWGGGAGVLKEILADEEDFGEASRWKSRTGSTLFGK